MDQTMPLVSPSEGPDLEPNSGDRKGERQLQAPQKSNQFAFPGTDAWFRKLVLAKLEVITSGALEWIEQGEVTRFGDGEAKAQQVVIHSAGLYRRIALGGSLGFAEAYLDGLWSTRDLTGLLQLFARNFLTVDRVNSWSDRLKAFSRRALSWARRNSRRGSRANISAHYDLNNAFYELWLDDTMTYSSGLYPRPEASLKEASINKYEQICRKLRLSPSDRVLEIGTGWGAFAEYAATEYGCQVTTTTISEKQYDYAHERFARAGLADRVTLLKEDYRDLKGKYDKLVSIEMIEAVGHEYFPTFMGVCSERLECDGVMALQAITIPDQRYEEYKHSMDFIQKHVFPGGALPSIGALTNAVKQVSDLRLLQLEDFAEHYAWTLAEWRQRFESSLDQIIGLGFNERFIRLWRYYLSYCEAGFRERQIGVAQLVYAKPGCRLECQGGLA